MSAISTLVAKFACTNLAAKFLAVNLLKMNSYIQKKNVLFVSNKAI